ncbi:MAG: hypothetical protein M3R55_04425 [Acidobacteriota bacterium]|nr:hypothetical protein [Acidobacteriota bacterium]
MTFVVLSTEPEPVMREWLNARQIRPDIIAHVEEAESLGFLLVPTILIVDKFGMVTDTLLERPSPQDQGRLFARLADSSQPPLDNSSFAQEDWTHQPPSPAPNIVMVDIGPRKPFPEPGVVSMPADEFEARAARELGKADRIGVKCHEVDVSACRVVGRRLRLMGFQQVTWV